ncbi:MAG: hypothetical protein RMK19_08615 [Bacteroidia bacterium]|nr:hypothetical protein [Bacteroidia bacterium]MDW8016058.1 hypothetical protein [Bacteroidia bacterium]
MSSLWLRYLRLWGIMLEARIEMVLLRWTVRVVSLFLIIGAGGLMLLLLTAGVISWIGGAERWAFGFWTGAALWGGIAVLIGVFGGSSLRRALPWQPASYRLRLAQAGLRLIEQRAFQSLSARPILALLYQYLGRFLWQIALRWLRRRIPFL